ncbi:MAG TPA: hypothetical protein VGL77_21490 [Armatimonadota bacterium]|jgi:hypothetical protein
MLIWSYALPGISTVALLAFIVLAATAEHRNVELLGQGVSFFCFFPVLIGLGMSIAAMDRHSPYSRAPWGSLIWNGFYLLIYVFLMIIGAQA